MVPSVRALPRRHAIYRLTPRLLLVFKPRGHREAEHAHPQRQRLTVLSGRLELRLGTRTVLLGPRTRPVLLRARQPHTTVARAATWLVVERPGG